MAGSAAATRSLLTGTSFGDNLIAVLPDVIGQTIGNAVAEGMQARRAASASKPIGQNQSVPVEELMPLKMLDIKPLEVRIPALANEKVLGSFGSQYDEGVEAPTSLSGVKYSGAADTVETHRFYEARDIQIERISNIEARVSWLNDYDQRIFKTLHVDNGQDLHFTDRGAVRDLRDGTLIGQDYYRYDDSALLGPTTELEEIVVTGKRIERPAGWNPQSGVLTDYSAGRFENFFGFQQLAPTRFEAAPFNPNATYHNGQNLTQEAFDRLPAMRALTAEDAERSRQWARQDAFLNSGNGFWNLSGWVAANPNSSPELICLVAAADNALLAPGYGRQISPRPIRYQTAPSSPFVNGASAPRFSAAEIASSPSLAARLRQGDIDYPGLDRFRDITLKPGTRVFAGDPGPTGFATTPRGFNRSGTDAHSVFQGLQVSPRNETYRPRMVEYEITNETQAAFGIVRANPHHGQGGLPQLFIPNFSEVARPVATYPLTNTATRRR